MGNNWCDGTDINKDGVVDGLDTSILSQNYGRTDCSEANEWCDGADLNKDGSVSISDLAILKSNMGRTDCLAGPPKPKIPWILIGGGGILLLSIILLSGKN